MTDVIFDQRSAPSATAVDGLLSGRSELWHLLIRQMEAMGGRGQWVWGGAKYGWELKFKRGARPFATLTPKPQSIVVLIILGRAEVAAVDLSALGERMRATFEAARQFPDGRWLFHTVEVERDVVDTLALLTLKLPPTVRARLRMAGS